MVFSSHGVFFGGFIGLYAIFVPKPVFIAKHKILLIFAREQ